MAYKSVPQKGSITSLIESGYAAFEELGSECDDAANNFPNSNHPKAEAFAEAASTLQDLSAPDLPSALDSNDPEVVWHEQVNKDKRKGPSRAVRAANGAAMLSAAADAIRTLVDDLKSEAQTIEENLTEDMPEETRTAATARSEEIDQQVTDLEEVADQLESDAGDAENVEFPGLYG